MTAPVQSEGQPAEGAKATDHGRGRRIAASVCLVLSVLLAPLAIVTTWTKQELLNTDRYVATVAPLADNRGLTDYLAGQVTEKLMTGLNVTAVARELAPEARPVPGGPAHRRHPDPRHEHGRDGSGLAGVQEDLDRRQPRRGQPGAEGPHG